jgi:hypothetical protein
MKVAAAAAFCYCCAWLTCFLQLNHLGRKGSRAGNSSSLLESRLTSPDTFFDRAKPKRGE